MSEDEDREEGKTPSYKCCWQITSSRWSEVSWLLMNNYHLSIGPKLVLVASCTFLDRTLVGFG